MIIIVLLLSAQAINLLEYRFDIGNEVHFGSYCCPVNENIDYDQLIGEVLNTDGLNENDALFTSVNFAVNNFNASFYAHAKGSNHPAVVFTLEMGYFLSRDAGLDLEGYIEYFVNDWEQYDNVYLLGFKDYEKLRHMLEEAGIMPGSKCFQPGDV